jgi:hypothetical protein
MTADRRGMLYPRPAGRRGTARLRASPAWPRAYRRVRTPMPGRAGRQTYDRDDVYREVCQRHPDAAVIVQPRSSAVPSATAEIAPTKRDRGGDLRLHGVGRVGAGVRNDDPQEPGLGIPGGCHPAYDAALCGTSSTQACHSCSSFSIGDVITRLVSPSPRGSLPRCCPSLSAIS